MNPEVPKHYFPDDDPDEAAGDEVECPRTVDLF